MDEGVAAVRRFNRAVTTRLGVLDDAYLSQRRPLGQARVLWEVSPDGCEVAVLRARLGLDSGQLSRTLRTLEADGLVTVDGHEADGRVRVARLSAAGRREWGELDSRSDDAAAGILAPLGAGQRARLLDALADVERLLLASLVEIGERGAGDPLARICLRAYAAEVEQRFGAPVPVDAARDGLVPPHGLLLVAVLQGEPVGCGGLRLPAGEPAEVKRLWVSPAARGTGLGRRLLAALEARAAQAGAERIRLDTNRTLTEASSLYRSAGYREIARYNDNPDAHHWFEKRL